MRRARRLRFALVALAVGALACPKPSPSADAGGASGDAFDPAEALLVDLEKDEAAWRASTDWAAFPSSDATLGPDPFDIVALPPVPGGAAFAGVLRGRSAVVLLDAEAHELDRAPAAHGARSLVVDVADEAPGADLDIAGDLDAQLWSVTAGGSGWSGSGPMFFTSGSPSRYIPRAQGLRGVVRGPHRALHVVDVNGRLVSSKPNASPARDERDVVARDIGPFALAPRVAANAKAAWLAVPTVQGHKVVVAQLDDQERLFAEREVTFDGPALGAALRVLPDGDALVAIGMIEDHPLDRTIGSFGFIDSFVRIVRVPRAPPGTVAARAAAPVVVADVNLSEHGVLIPKALAFLDDATLLVAGAGSAKAARLHIGVSSATVEVIASLPGVVALVPTATGFVGASPLLDAWVIVDDKGARAVAVPTAGPETQRFGRDLHGPPAGTAERSVESKLGEALVFTNVMAPRQQSDGALSRFTCEACHYEGIVDGRTHDTGRMAHDSAVDAGVTHEVEAHVRATTKPLWGLFNNKPLFTRAMDPNLSRMVHAEFRVANNNSALDPWFALTPADAPWLSLLGVDGTRSPIELRKAVLAFLRDFTPRTNPNVQSRLAGVTGTKAFTHEEQHGAEVFRARCVSCHAARLIGDDPTTEQPFERWESLVMSANGPLVWSSPEHRKTGIEPYVHEEGARASSLRRVWLKSPLFTTGAARTLEEALDLARIDGETFLHSSKRGVPLADDEKRDLVAFLRLL